MRPVRNARGARGHRGSISFPQSNFTSSRPAAKRHTPLPGGAPGNSPISTLTRCPGLTRLPACRHWRRHPVGHTCDGGAALAQFSALGIFFIESAPHNRTMFSPPFGPFPLVWRKQSYGLVGQGKAAQAQSALRDFVLHSVRSAPM